MDGKTLALALATVLFAPLQPIMAQTDSTETQQPVEVVVNAQHHFAQTIPPGNYSGITWLGDDRYAVVSDKSKDDGFFVFQIKLDSLSGEVLDARNIGFHSAGSPGRDDEGICYVPQRNTIFISGEADNAIREYTLEGKRTGFTMPLPECYSHLPANLGLEALSYDAATRTMWTCNESDTVYIHAWSLADEDITDSIPRSIGTWRYLLDAPTEDKSQAWMYAHGIGTICAFNDSLLVLEREAYVPQQKLGALVTCKLFLLSQLKPTSEIQDAPQKQLVATWTTRLNLLSRSFANYEGMCLGPQLQDGSRVLLLVADSQDQYAGVLHDWIKSIKIFSPKSLQDIK